MSSSTTEREARLVEVIAAYRKAVEQGHKPDRQELLARHPDLASDLADFFDGEDRLDRLLDLVRPALPDPPPAPLAATEKEPVPDPFPGEFRVLRFLGKGAFGNVWLAADLNLCRQVALKTLRLDGDPAAVARKLAVLQHEARTLAQFRHPNLVQVHALRRAGDDHYLVMQYVAGGSLAGRLKKDGALRWPLAARYIADVGEGLLEVHAAGIVHRDIKPGNILWDPVRDEALLTDFGLAAHLAAAGERAGTWLYMAPEALDGQANPRMDVYSLAATLFQLVTGEVPFLPAPPLHSPKFVPELRRLIAQGLPEPEPRLAGVPEVMERLLRAGLAAKPERRPELEEFVTRLRTLLNQLLADTLSVSQERPPAPVDLRVRIQRQKGDTYTPVASTHPPAEGTTRDMKKVPPRPEQVRLHTGDRVRVEVLADQPGHVTVFNVGPTGQLNLLYPDDPAAPPPALPARQPLNVLDVELTPPAGRERVFAVWSRQPLPLHREDLLSLAERGELPGSRSYHATRDMKRVQDSLQRLPQEEWKAVVLEVEHEV
jgi:serine/threonine-protein kinase